MKRTNFSIRTLLFIIISFLNVIIAAPLAYTALRSFVSYQNAQNVRVTTETLDFLYNSKKYLSHERAAANVIAYISDKTFPSLKGKMATSRDLADLNLDKAFVVIESMARPNIHKSLENVRGLYARVKEIRKKFDQQIEAQKRSEQQALSDEYFARITDLIKGVDAVIDAYMQPVAFFNTEVTRHMLITRLIWGISEYAGQEYAILGRVIAQNKFPDSKTRETLLSLRGRIQYGMEIAQGAVSVNRWRDVINPALKEAQTHYLMIFDQTKDIFYQDGNDSSNTVYPISVEMWLQMATEAVSSFESMTDTVLKVNRLHVNQIEEGAVQSIYISIFLLLCSLTLSYYTWWLITLRVIRPVNSMVEALYEETKLADKKIPASYDLDEISKLEKVLHVFRENTRALLEERNKAQAANIAKSDFLANMSHEIRTPMNVVVGLSNILARTDPLTNKQSKFIRTLQVSAESLLALINDLLDFSKIESQSFQLERVAFNLGKLIDDLSLIKDHKARFKGLHFVTDIKGIQGKEYIGDPTRIRQVLVNLCGNAIKFTEEGRVELKVRSFPHEVPSYEEIEITVTDTGIGIPHDKLEAVFEKFTQADSSIMRKYGGTGLGLAITKSLVSMMGGKITVQSSLSQGTVFRVVFPLRVEAQQSLFNPQLEKSEKEIPDVKGTGHVLLVEDFEPNILVTGSLLEEYGYSYDVATSGQEAVSQYRTNTYDIILMDIQMPGMDGYQATRTIRQIEMLESRKPVRIIGLTAHASNQDRQNCLASGMDDYLSKPFDHNKFKDILMPANTKDSA